MKSPLRSLDEAVQKQYTRIGKKIPDKSLYKLTFGLQMAGKLSAGAMGVLLQKYQLFPGFYGLVHGVFIDGPDFSLNLRSLTGRLNPKSNSESIALDPLEASLQSYNRKMRLPLFVAGLTFVGKAAYDIANYFISGEPLNSDAASLEFIMGCGFLSTASSMYLKDQDPKLLEKKPSKIKAFFKGIYEKVRDSNPLPTPNPIPVPARYSTLEDCL